MLRKCFIPLRPFFLVSTTESRLVRRPAPMLHRTNELTALCWHKPGVPATGEHGCQIQAEIAARHGMLGRRSQDLLAHWVSAVIFVVFKFQ